MSATSPSALDQLRHADRIARAASLWLRREQAGDGPGRRPGPEHRDLLAGLVAGLGSWLRVDAMVLAVAAYSLALLEQERDGALDTSARLAPAAPEPPAYREGLGIARRLVADLRQGGGPVGA
jgi:hypothetical protein